MARAKTNPWDAVLRRIRGIYRPEWVYPPMTTAVDLDAAEKELNFRFPASYRAFAERFGLGGDLLNLPEVLPLTCPPWADRSDWFRSVLGATRFFQTHDHHLEWTSTPATFFKRVVVFALDGGYHHFVFDPLEVTNARLNECRIYDIDRSNEAVAIARSFGGWLEWIGQHYRFEDEGAEEEQAEPQFPIVYKPDSAEPDPMSYWRRSARREKALPEPQDVRLWLEWNKGAVRGLVRSIRDEGHADVFPVLADALEEAGCKNADLLDACRHGDPDIDGVWVLRVLLDP
jgi:hypothetical protein